MADEVKAAQMQAEPDPKKAEMIRDHAPHPWELAGVVSEGYEHLEEGRWRFTVAGGWYEDVVNGLFMEGYQIRRIRKAGDGVHLHIDVVEERLLETGICPCCGERNEPDFSGDSTTCPDCGGEF